MPRRFQPGISNHPKPRGRPTRFPRFIQESRFLSNLPIAEEEEDGGVVLMATLNPDVNSRGPLTTTKFIGKRLQKLNLDMEDVFAIPQDFRTSFTKAGDSHFLNGPMAGASFSDLFTSQDKTKSWIDTFSHVTLEQSPFGRPCIVASGSDIYMSTVFENNATKVFIYKSIDKGFSWTEINTVPTLVASEFDTTDNPVMAAHPTIPGYMAMLLTDSPNVSTNESSAQRDPRPFLAITTDGWESYISGYIENVFWDEISSSPNWENIKFTDDGRLCFVFSAKRRVPTERNTASHSGGFGPGTVDISWLVSGPPEYTNAPNQITLIWVWNTGDLTGWGGNAPIQIGENVDFEGGTLRLFYVPPNATVPANYTITGTATDFEAYAFTWIDPDNPFGETTGTFGGIPGAADLEGRWIEMELSPLTDPYDRIFFNHTQAVAPPFVFNPHEYSDTGYYDSPSNLGMVQFYDGGKLGFSWFEDGNAISGSIAIQLHAKPGAAGMMFMWSDTPLDFSSYQWKEIDIGLPKWKGKTYADRNWNDLSSGGAINGPLLNLKGGLSLLFPAVRGELMYAYPSFWGLQIVQGQKFMLSTDRGENWEALPLITGDEIHQPIPNWPPLPPETPPTIPNSPSVSRFTMVYDSTTDILYVCRQMNNDSLGGSRIWIAENPISGSSAWEELTSEFGSLWNIVLPTPGTLINNIGFTQIKIGAFQKY